MAATTSITLLMLPDEILEYTLSCLDYEQVSEKRIVCRHFDRACQNLLNQGFSKVDKYHALCQKQVKAQLPRRESERRNHHLARHVDILAAIETRLSLLGMTFMKYIDMGICCFIPGKVLDEIFRVLRFIQKNPTPPRAHELLQELRDISSMAMEHFDEKIVPILKQKMPQPMTLNNPFHTASSPLASQDTPKGLSLCISAPIQQNARIPGIRQEMLQLKSCNRSTSTTVILLKRDLTELKNKLAESKKKMLEQEKKILDQTKIISEQSKKMTTQEKTIHDLHNKMLTHEQIFVQIQTDIADMKDTFSFDNPSQKETVVKDENITTTKRKSRKKVETLTAEKSDRRCRKRKTIPAEQVDATVNTNKRKRTSRKTT